MGLQKYMLNPRTLSEAFWVEVPLHKGLWIKTKGILCPDRRKALENWQEQNRDRIANQALVQGEAALVDCETFTMHCLEDWRSVDGGLEAFDKNIALDMLMRPEALVLREAFYSAARNVQKMTDKVLEEAAKNLPKPSAEASAA